MNLGKLTYKLIYYIIIASVILLTIITYSLSIKNTAHTISEYFDLKEKVENMKDAPQKIINLKQQITQMEHILIEDKGIDTEQLLLEKATTFCKNSNLTLIEFPQTFISEFDDYQILTNKIVLEGSFKENLKFIYDSEQKNKQGMVSSVQLSKKKEIRTNKVSLFSTIYFQNIKLNE